MPFPPSFPTRHPSGHPIRALAVALVVGCAAWASAQTAKYPNYYPSQPGTRWVYSSGEIQVIGTPLTYKGVKVTPVSHQYGSTTYTQDLLEFRPDGSVWLRGVDTPGRRTWYTPPINVYPPAPLSPGLKWSSSTSTLKTSSTVTGFAPVRTGAKSYNAVAIRTETNAGGRISTQVSYFVPGLGVVRYETADGSKIDLVR